MLTLQNIINEADLLVPNEFTNAEKVVWLNEINNRFFDTVKIPLVASFTSIANQSSYTLTSGVRAKNIDRVMLGPYVYDNGLIEDVNPTMNHHTFDDITGTLTLTPAPLRSGLRGLVRYFRIATTTFTSSSLNVRPDAPEEYHHVYVPGLASNIAGAMEDVAKANNYENMFVNLLNVAAQNYQKVMT